MTYATFSALSPHLRDFIPYRFRTILYQFPVLGQRLPQPPAERPAAGAGRGSPSAPSGRAAGCGRCPRGPAGGAAAPRWPRSLPSALPLEQPETSWRHFEAGRGTGASCGRGGGWRRLAAAAAAAAPLRARSGGSAERTRLRPARRGGCGGVRTAALRPRVPPPVPAPFSLPGGVGGARPDRAPRPALEKDGEWRRSGRAEQSSPWPVVELPLPIPLAPPRGCSPPPFPLAAVKY